MCNKKVLQNEMHKTEIGSKNKKLLAKDDGGSRLLLASSNCRNNQWQGCYGRKVNTDPKRVTEETFITKTMKKQSLAWLLRADGFPEKFLNETWNRTHNLLIVNHLQYPLRYKGRTKNVRKIFYY